MARTTRRNTTPRLPSAGPEALSPVLPPLPASRSIFFCRFYCHFYCRFWLPFLVAVLHDFPACARLPFTIHYSRRSPVSIHPATLLHPWFKKLLFHYASRSDRTKRSYFLLLTIRVHSCPSVCIRGSGSWVFHCSLSMSIRGSRSWFFHCEFTPTPQGLPASCFLLRVYPDPGRAVHLYFPCIYRKQTSCGCEINGLRSLPTGSLKIE